MKNSTEQELLFHKELLNLSQNMSIDSGRLDESLEAITKAAASALRVARSSVWLYNHDQTSIVCKTLFDITATTQTSGLELKAQDFPAYFNYLSEERTLPASDAHTDPATFEFSEAYLKPLNIFSMLDAPIRVNGKMIGVICCEQVGNPRHWTSAEQTFLGNITDIIARAIHAKEKEQALARLEEVNSHLELLVQDKIDQLEEQRARSMFASKMATLGEMAGSIAHEINTPLAIINTTLSYYKRLDKVGGVTPEIAAEVFQEIEQTSLRIGKIIKGLRFFARDSSHDQFSESSLNQIVDDTLSLCQEKFKASGCEISSDVPPDTKLKCQAVSISQALLNLISNAFDAVANESAPWINIVVQNTEKDVLIRIVDSGRGIDESMKEKIMMPFFTSKPVGKGTGLGLSIVQGIVEHHHGKFFIDGDCPNTCFVIAIPKTQAA